MTMKQRWLGIAGLVFVILVVVSVFSLPSPPDSHASAAKAVAYYHKHKSGLQVSTYITELAVFVGFIFFWFFREHLARATPESKSLVTLGFFGALLFAVSGAVASGISWSLADSVNHVDPSVVQMLNVLNIDLIGFIGGPGVAIFLGATGLAIIRYRALPVWLGWAGVVLAVVALVIGFFGLVGIALWIIAASIVLLVRTNAAEPATA
jgi:hypothetical protein